jgi:hypothetical protein
VTTGSAWRSIHPNWKCELVLDCFIYVPTNGYDM